GDAVDRPGPGRGAAVEYVVLSIRAGPAESRRMRDSRARAVQAGGAGVLPGVPRNGCRAPRIRSGDKLIVRALTFERRRRLIGRAGRVATRAGRRGEGGEGERREHEPLRRGAGHGIPFRLTGV